MLSFCSGLPFFWVMTEQDVWNANKRAIASYAPTEKDLKLIWERDPKTDRIITSSNRFAISGPKILFRLSLAEEQALFTS